MSELFPRKANLIINEISQNPFVKFTYYVYMCLHTHIRYITNQKEISSRILFPFDSRLCRRLALSCTWTMRDPKAVWTSGSECTLVQPSRPTRGLYHERTMPTRYEGALPWIRHSANESVHYFVARHDAAAGKHRQLAYSDCNGVWCVDKSSLCSYGWCIIVGSTYKKKLKRI